MRKITRIVFHCTGGAQSQTLQSIQNHWRNVMGWNSPGYHHLIMSDGTIHNLQPIERSSNGAAGFNANSIHISYVGGIDSRGRISDNRTPQQREEMKKLAIRYFQLYPNADFIGHRDLSPDKNRDGVISQNEWVKACPSFSVKQWLIDENIMVNVKQPIVKKSINTNGGSLNIRSTPLIGNNIIGTIPNGTSVIVLGVSGTFTQIQVNDKLIGYVSSQFIN